MRAILTSYRLAVSLTSYMTTPSSLACHYWVLDPFSLTQQNAQTTETQTPAKIEKKTPLNSPKRQRKHTKENPPRKLTYSPILTSITPHHSSSSSTSSTNGNGTVTNIGAGNFRIRNGSGRTSRPTAMRSARGYRAMLSSFASAWMASAVASSPPAS